MLYSIDLKNKTAKQIAKFFNHGASVTKTIFHSKKDWIITSSEDQTVNIFTKDGKLFKSLKEHTGTVTDIKISNDGTKLYSSYSDKIRSWDLEKFTSNDLPNVTHTGKITGIAVHPTHSSIYSIGVNEYTESALKYASSDAEITSKQIEKVAKTSNLYKDIYTKLLTSKDDTTKASIVKNFEALKKSKIQDTVIISFSGHGQKTDDNLYYLLPSDFPL